MADQLGKVLNEPGNPVLKTFRSSDGYEWYYRHFAPAGQIRGRIISIHGIQSHGGWYPRSCARFAEDGYEVFFLDRRGSGLNQVGRGNFPSFRRVLDDFKEFIDALPADGLPKFLLAISWGGKLGIGMQYRYPGSVDGLILICPGIVAKVQPPFFQRLWIGRCRVRCPSRMFPIPLNDPKLFTSSPHWQEFVANDPLALREATARVLFSSFSLDMYLKRARKYVTLPVLMLLAEHDEIIHNAKVRKYFDRVPTQDKTVIEYAGAHHTIEFEADGHPWIGDVLSWLKS